MNGLRNDSRYLYEFDGFRADPVRRRLSRGGEVVSLTPKAFSILLALLEKRGQVVPKEDLIQQIWPDTFVTEANLTQNISSLRKALGERANDPRYVVTVPGQGYSFVADVLEIPRDGTGEMPAFILPPPPVLALVETPAAALPAPLPEPPAAVISPVPFVKPPVPLPLVEPASPPPAAPRGPDPSLLEDTGSFKPAAPPGALPQIRRRSRPALLLVLLAVLLVSVPLLYIYRAGLSSWPAVQAARASPRPDRPSVAVLGFTNLSGTPQAAWLANALTEMLNTELQTGGKVRLIPVEHVLQGRAAVNLPDGASLRAAELKQLHTLLGADLIVYGSYISQGERAGGRIRLEVQVVKVPSGEDVARRSELGVESDLFGLISRTGADLRRDLGWASPSPAQARKAEALRPANPEAIRLYTEGLAHLRAFDPQGARNLLTRAADADPKSAVVRSSLAHAWSDLGYDTRAAVDAQKAVQLAGSLSKQEQLAIEARSYESKREWSKASELYRSLWTFFPDDLEYGLLLTNALAEANHGEEALAEVARLRELPAPKRDDPRIDLSEAKAARRLWESQRSLNAAKSAELKGWKLGENQVVAQALALEGQAVQIMGRLDEAMDLFRQASALFAKSGNQAQVATMLTATGVTLDDQGQLAQAQKQFELALGIAQKLGNNHMVATQLANLGLLRQESGDLSQARTLLDRAVALYAETGDTALGTRTTYFVGKVLWEQGDAEGARQRYEKVLSGSRESGSRIDQAVALEGLGQILAGQGQLVQAQKQIEEALAIVRELNDPYRTAGIEASMADVMAHLGDFDGAQKRFGQALENRRRIGGRLGAAEILGSLAELAYLRGDLAKSRQVSLEQLSVAQEAGAQLLLAEALQNLGRIELAQGDLEGARGRFEKALGMAVSLGGGLSAASIRLDLARLELLGNRVSQAVLQARQAADWYARRKMPGEQARALALLAEGLARQGSLGAASEPAEQARALADRSDDRELQVTVTTIVARVDAMAGKTRQVLGHLPWAINRAKEAGLVTASLEARLALGMIQVEAGDRLAGLQLLAAVRSEAVERGFRLIALRAEAALKSAAPASRLG